ncbi:MAG: hypothetical protein CMN30_12690 [Sandaracinus sp.]|nr:hypothetical protein [Sandaracinus sp.]
MTPFKPIKTLGSVLAVFLCLSMLTDLVSIVSTLAQHALLERMVIGDYTMAEAESNDLRQNLIGAITLIVFIGTVITFLVWTYRAYANVDALGGIRSHGKGWAVGGWFTPFLNLVRPFQIVREAWAVGERVVRDEVSALNPPWWINTWWAFWIIGNLIGNVVFRLDDQSLESFIANTRWYVANDLASLVSAAFAAVVVLRTSALQTEAAGRSRPHDLQQVFS